MCALIGYRRGPGGHHRQAANQTRSRSSAGFVQNVIGCMNLTFMSAGSRPACRDGQSWSSAAAPYIVGQAGTAATPQSRRCGPGQPPHRPARLGKAALVGMSVVARLEPGHTRSMALGCSTTTPTGYARPRPSPRRCQRRAKRHFVFCVDCYRKRKITATGLNVS